MNTFIDASYAVHPNMRGHTGGAISFGVGIIHGKASKQKINVKSSTECELVGVSEYIPYSLWLGYFLEHQGYKLKSNLVHQDNQSAMRMKLMVEHSVLEILVISISDISLSRIEWIVERSRLCIVRLVGCWRIISLNHYKEICLKNLEQSSWVGKISALWMQLTTKEDVINMKSSKVRSVLVNGFYHFYSLLFLTNSWTDDEEVRIYKYIQKGREI